MKNIDIEINSIQAIKNSASKLLMKQCFQEAEIKTAKWGTANNLEELKTLAKELTGDWKSKLVCKSHFGSRNQGNTFINNEQELINWIGTRTLSNYIFEKYYSYLREYRLHITEDGVFYTCRKMLKNDTKNRLYRNSENSVWYVQENPLFNKPSNWDKIIEECIKGLKAVGLDIGAFDIKVQGKEYENPDFFIIEVNSAPSMQEITLQKYLEIIPKIIEKKIALKEQK